MIQLQSLRRSGLAFALTVCWSWSALDAEELGPPPAPVPDPASSAPHPGLIAPEPINPVVCHCKHCQRESRRSRGLFGWCWGRPADNSIAEYHAICSGCNIDPEPPFGTSYQATMQAQIAKGEAALMVLHHFDFVPCEGRLSVRGRMQLRKIAERAAHNPFPIIIEASREDPALDAARHAAVLAELAWFPCPVAADRVFIGPSLTRGLDGLDAELIHQNLLNQTRSGVGQAAAPEGNAGATVP